MLNVTELNASDAVAKASEILGDIGISSDTPDKASKVAQVGLDTLGKGDKQ